MVLIKGKSGMYRKIIIIAMVILLTSITAVSFGKGGGGAGGAGGGGMGSDGGAGTGSDSGQGNSGGNTGKGDEGSKSGMTQGTISKDILIDFFKNLDVFEITEEEETNLIENAWNDENTHPAAGQP